MVSIKISNSDLNKFERQVRKHIMSKFDNLFSYKLKPFLLQQLDVLTTQIARSSEYRQLFTDLVGQFGFTEEELTKPMEVLRELVKDPVTKITIKANGANKVALLEVDYDALKSLPAAQHDLTHYDESTGSWVLTERISWVEWFEEGKTVRGYTFEQPHGDLMKFSRSGWGLMMSSDRPGAHGSFWIWLPTQLFHQTLSQISIDKLKKGVGILIAKQLKG